MASTQPDGSATRAPRNGPDILPLIQALAGVGCGLIVLYALRFWPTGEVLRIAGVGVLVGAAALVAGVLSGFIFGIPREGSQKKPGDQDAAASDAQTNPVTSNSNLVEISDWLTKIIVGVSLVELNKIPAKLGALSYYVGRSLQPAQCGGAPACSDLILSGQSVALAIMIFYFALGFLWGYIWTRTSFQRNLEERYKKLQQENVALLKEKEAVDLIVLAEKSIDEDRLDEAMQWIDEALKKNPKDGRAVLTKGRIYKRQAMESGLQSAEGTRLLNQALTCADRSIDLMPPETKAEPTYNKACYQARLGFDKKEVLATLQAAFELNPRLRKIAKTDDDLKTLWEDADFTKLTDENRVQGS
jgi:tetratricopeptide (TPR) repeat protein